MNKILIIQNKQTANYNNKLYSHSSFRIKKYYKHLKMIILKKLNNNN